MLRVLKWFKVLISILIGNIFERERSMRNTSHNKNVTLVKMAYRNYFDSNRKHLTYIFLKDKVAWEMHFKAKSASPLVYNLFSIIPELY